MFSLLYLTIGWLLYVAALPILLLLTLFPKYRHSIPARFFLWHNPPFKESALWFHACSFGEVRALAPIVQALEHACNITVITQTGYEAAGRYEGERRYLPFEIFLPFWVRKQKALVVMEAELWYMLFVSAKKRGIPTYLINARISERSFGRYLRFSWFYRKIFAHIDLVFAQSEADRERLLKLGARCVEVTGNIKSVAPVTVTRRFEKPQRNLLVVASTHEGEEEEILRELDWTGRCIVVVPRHPERFPRVAKVVEQLAREREALFHRYSQNSTLSGDIVLMDRMGELVNLYAIADIVILGGSFVEGVGGHNPLEPANFGVKLVSGPYFFNQKALYPLVEGIEICPLGKIEVAIAGANPVQIVSRADLRPIIEELQRVV